MANRQNIQSGYIATITQNASQTVSVGASNFIQAAGTFSGGDKRIDVNGDFTLSGGTFTSTSDVLEVSGTFNRSGGTFALSHGGVDSVRPRAARSRLAGSQSPPDTRETPFGRLNAYASYADIVSMERDRRLKALPILVLALVIGLIVVKFLGGTLNRAY